MDMPSSQQPKRRRRKFDHHYSKSDLDEATAKVKDGDLSLNEAADKYIIPRSTIDSRLRKDGYYSKEKIIPDPILPPEVEIEVLSWISTMNQVGFVNIVESLPVVIREICEMFGKHTMFPVSNLPALKYCQNFVLERDLKIDIIDVNISSSKITDNWMTKLQRYLENLNELDTETFLNGTSKQVYCFHKVAHAVRNEDSTNAILTSDVDNDLEHQRVMSMYSCVGGDGEILKPIITVKYRGAEQKFIDNQNLNCFVSWSREGCMDIDTLLDWLQDIVAHLEAQNIPKPYLFFLDQFLHPISPMVLEYCKTRELILFYLPHIRSDILFPFGINIYNKMVESFNEKTSKVRKNPLSKQGTLDFILKCWLKSIDSTVIKQEFKTTGIFPLRKTYLERCIKSAMHGENSIFLAPQCTEHNLRKRRKLFQAEGITRSSSRNSAAENLHSKSTSIKLDNEIDKHQYASVEDNAVPNCKPNSITVKTESCKDESRELSTSTSSTKENGGAYIKKKLQTKLKTTKNPKRSSSKLFNQFARKRKYMIREIPKKSLNKSPEYTNQRNVPNTEEKNNADKISEHKNKENKPKELSLGGCVRKEHKFNQPSTGTPVDKDKADSPTKPRMKSLTLEDGQWVIRQHDGSTNDSDKYRLIDKKCLSCKVKLEEGRRQGIKEGVLMALHNIEALIPQDLLTLYQNRYQKFKTNKSSLLGVDLESTNCSQKTNTKSRSDQKMKVKPHSFIDSLDFPLNIEPAYISWITMKLCIDFDPCTIFKTITEEFHKSCHEESTNLPDVSSSALEKRKAIIALVRMTHLDNLPQTSHINKIHENTPVSKSSVDEKNIPHQREISHSCANAISNQNKSNDHIIKDNSKLASFASAFGNRHFNNSNRFELEHHKLVTPQHQNSNYFSESSNNFPSHDYNNNTNNNNNNNVDINAVHTLQSRWYPADVHRRQFQSSIQNNPGVEYVRTLHTDNLDYPMKAAHPNYGVDPHNNTASCLPRVSTSQSMYNHSTTGLDYNQIDIRYPIMNHSDTSTTNKNCQEYSEANCYNSNDQYSNLDRRHVNYVLNGQDNKYIVPSTQSFHETLPEPTSTQFIDTRHPKIPEYPVVEIPPFNSNVNQEQNNIYDYSLSSNGVNKTTIQTAHKSEFVETLVIEPTTDPLADVNCSLPSGVELSCNSQDSNSYDDQNLVSSANEAMTRYPLQVQRNDKILPPECLAEQTQSPPSNAPCSSTSVSIGKNMSDHASDDSVCNDSFDSKLRIVENETSDST